MMDSDSNKPNNIEVLIKLQDGLNKEITSDWKTKRNLDQFDTAASIEIGEFLDTIPHKWWKGECCEDLPSNWYKLDKYKSRVRKGYLELVDILHFILSAAILDNVDCLIKPKLPIKFTKVNNHKFRDFLNTKLVTRNYIEILYGLVAIADVYEFDIISYYVAKHTLNRIRQIRGDKEGKYSKIINGKEDNELLLECIPIDFIKNDLTDTFDLEKYEKLVNIVYEKFDIDKNKRYLLKSYI